MSLLQQLPYEEYRKAIQFTREQCYCISKLANLGKIEFVGPKKPGELLMKMLDRKGLSVEQYKNLINTVSYEKRISYYNPQSKIALLIGNDKYKHLGKLVTPSKDCKSLSAELNQLGFITIILNNVLTSKLKYALRRVFQVIPENSYCLIFYGGHGCELYNVKCMLSVDCPVENIQPEHFITESFLLKEAAACKPDLCMLFMDMCRIHLDISANPKLVSNLETITDYSIHKNLLISYATASSASAYEVLQIECSDTINTDLTYELQAGDLVVKGASQYASVLCSKLSENLCVCELIDTVHEEVEKSHKKQRPLKLQCGVFKRSLHDEVLCDNKDMKKNLENIATEIDLQFQFI